MTRLSWSEGNHFGGVDRGVIFPRVGPAEVWNGLMAVAENVSDIRSRVRYRDGVKVVNQRAEDSFSATIECFTYPDILLNARAVFDLSYRVKKGNGYEIHLVYNALARLSRGAYVQSEVTPINLDISTRPRSMPLLRMPSAHLIIDTVDAYPPVVASFEDMLYGTDNTEPHLPAPEDLITIFDINSLYRVIDNGDGTFTLEAPDGVFEWLEATKFEVDWPRVRYISEDSYVLRNG